MVKLSQHIMPKTHNEQIMTRSDDKRDFKAFYLAFENKFRGPRDLIKARLRVYMPFVEPLHAFHKPANAVDLGCGRGEWLELMQEYGFDAHGVDIDDAMLAICRDLGLKVHKNDAISFLKGLPETSQSVVSGFHIAEHILFTELQDMVQEAMRVLKPGGLLILETPNPDNLLVGASSFYLDPSHHRPIPLQLLSFLPEYYGFARVKTLRLQEGKDLANKTSLTFYDVLDGVSPDYAVIAQKDGAEDLFHSMDPAFGSDYGLSLPVIAANYDSQLKISAQEAQIGAQEAINKAEQADTRAREAINKAEQADTRAREAINKAEQAKQALNAIYRSRSWRITAPLRWGMTLFKKVAKAVLRNAVRIARKIYPLRILGNRLLKRFPVLRVHFARIINSYNSYRLLNTQKQMSVNVPLTEPGDEKYIPDKLRVNSLVEKDVNQVTINEIILKVRDEYEKRNPHGHKPVDLFDIMMGKIRNEYYGKS